MLTINPVLWKALILPLRQIQIKAKYIGMRFIANLIRNLWRN